MFLDALTKLETAHQITADADSGSSYDAGNTTPKRDFGMGEPCGILVAITAVGTNSGSSKLQAIMSASSSLGTNTIVGEVDLAAGDLVAGKLTIVPIGTGPTCLRYFGLHHDITGTVDYTCDAYIGPLSMLQRQAEKYAKGYTITG